MKNSLNRYKAHRIVALVFVPFLLISVLTGFFRANYKWFWKEDYKKVKNSSFENIVSKPAVDVDSVFSILETKLQDEEKIAEVKLKSEIGRLFYDVRLKNKTAILIDADKGTILSPLSEELAKVFASQYVSEGMILKKFYADDNYLTRKEKKKRPVYVAEYDDPLNTVIYIDRNNGEIEEEADDNLRFGFWMVKLHDYDFWNAKRIILSLVGIGLFLVSITGIYVWIKNKRMKKTNPRPFTFLKFPFK